MALRLQSFKQFHRVDVEYIKHKSAIPDTMLVRNLFILICKQGRIETAEDRKTSQQYSSWSGIVLDNALHKTTAVNEPTQYIFVFVLTPLFCRINFSVTSATNGMQMKSKQHKTPYFWKYLFRLRRGKKT